MIVSASRRTDIPANYTEWLFRRLREGYALVRNPTNARQVSRVCLTRDHVDGFVFWTKNPMPLIPHIGELRDYPFYVQFTLNAYGPEVEPNVPDKEQLIAAFRQLSQVVGPHRAVWRYDPVFFSEYHTVEFHMRNFRNIAEQLSGATDTCTMSFVDMYAKTKRNAARLGLSEGTPEEQLRLARRMSETAQSYGIQLTACAEPVLDAVSGITRARCIDPVRLLGRQVQTRADANQRQECSCAPSVDIGAYHTCAAGCLYCYANNSPARAAQNAAMHDPASPLLFGTLREDDVVRERDMPLLKTAHQTMLPGL